MGLFHKEDLDSLTKVSLSDLGNRAIEENSINDIKQYAIATMLEEHSPQSVKELTRQSKLGSNKTKDILVKLITSHLVNIVGTTDKRKREIEDE